LQNKVVQQHENGANPQRCHIKILDKYLALLSTEAKSNDVLYLCALPKKPAEPGKP